MIADMNEHLAKTEAELAATKARTDELEREVAILRDPSYIYACGSNEYLPGSSGTIPYTSLIYSSINTEGRGQDITTGVFTAPHGGFYWDTSARLESGEWLKINLQKNGGTIQESEHYSYYGGPSGFELWL